MCNKMAPFFRYVLIAAFMASLVGSLAWGDGRATGRLNQTLSDVFQDELYAIRKAATSHNAIQMQVRPPQTIRDLARMPLICFILEFRSSQPFSVLQEYLNSIGLRLGLTDFELDYYSANGRLPPISEKSRIDALDLRHPSLVELANINVHHVGELLKLTLEDFLDPKNGSNRSQLVDEVESVFSRFNRPFYTDAVEAAVLQRIPLSREQSLRGIEMSDSMKRILMRLGFKTVDDILKFSSTSASIGGISLNKKFLALRESLNALVRGDFDSICDVNLTQSGQRKNGSFINNAKGT